MKLREITNFARTVSGARYGFELEVEGRRLPIEGPQNWDVKRDGSLGETGLEYVTRQAFGHEKFELMLERLDNHFKSSRSELNCSVSCSCHVHMNVQDLSLKEISQILVAYFTVEDILCDFAGPDRAGNLFCLRLSDSDESLENFMRSIEENNLPLLSQVPRYTAVNLNSLMRFGTLEFRAFGGIKKTPMEMKEWAEILHAIRVFALSYPDPASILADVSLEGPKGFFNRMFENEEHRKLLEPFFNETRVMEAVRRCQWLAYSVDFSRLKPRGRDGGLGLRVERF